MSCIGKRGFKLQLMQHKVSKQIAALLFSFKYFFLIIFLLKSKFMMAYWNCRTGVSAQWLQATNNPQRFEDFQHIIK